MSLLDNDLTANLFFNPFGLDFNLETDYYFNDNPDNFFEIMFR